MKRILANLAANLVVIVLLPFALIALGVMLLDDKIRGRQ